MSINWSERIAQRAREMSSSAIRDLLKLTVQPEIISFGGGLPAPELFPTEEIGAACEQALVESPDSALQYGTTEGHAPLREMIAGWMHDLGMRVSPSQTLITSGSQQALDMLGKLLIDPGAPIAVESPTYLGALQAWQPYRPQLLPLPMDAQGLQVEALAEVLARGVRPRFLYIVSSFQNPTGVTLAPERRRALVELAGRYDLPIIEDDPYGELYYEGTRATPLAALDCQLYGELRHVIYLSTFSKLLTPGLRVGWLIAPTGLIDKLVQVKQGLDLHTGSLAQVAAYLTCRDGLLERHIPVLREVYGQRRDVMLAALHATMPAGVRWTHPAGGMFLWVTLPDGWDSAELLGRAIGHQVAFVPGRTFYPAGDVINTMRLNFSFSPPELIKTGISRLAEVVRSYAPGGQLPL
ncbi:PLP-dependent aminotransferase family protein [Candidatus Oscillochloris fontis]|uniref:aminotransferase-like domain-containing protein n=1 Tax=Candidatus Oscillochloris fontis TaxID=2496868 RepID=UPI00101C154D|nr:PLP-dependent aminotransferase family protein [Candidatus Oscillochloris fontis]